jgi:hypothetical protein
MKDNKFYLSVFMLTFLILICGVESMAQINSKPCGIKLEGSRTEIKTFLTENDYEFSIIDTKKGPAYYVKDMWFQDIRWDYVMVCFHESKCAAISFIKLANGDLAKILIYGTCANVLGNISDKYSKYIVEHKNSSDSSNDELEYSDGTTTINLVLETPEEGDGKLMLTYSNNVLAKKLLYDSTNGF